jgi:adenylate cyclase class 2
LAEGWISSGIGTARRPGKAAHVFLGTAGEVPNHEIGNGAPATHAEVKGASANGRTAILYGMATHQEVEIKFGVDDVRALIRRLRTAGFRLLTRRTHESNTLYDRPDQSLRRRGELLRLRQYGPKWILTHKAKGRAGRHKTRLEVETEVGDGTKMDAILRALGYAPTFGYEKFRAVWNDGQGHVVIDETPIGNFGEIEGPPRWIDRTARLLGIEPRTYITETYAGLFFQWKRRTRSRAREMTFAAVKRRP